MVKSQANSDSNLFVKQRTFSLLTNNNKIIPVNQLMNDSYELGNETILNF